MANRTMQQKTLKLRRQKRAWFKNMQGRGLQQPNREIIRMHKDRAKGLEDEAFVDSMGIELLKKEYIEKKEAYKKQGTLEAWLPKDCTLRSSGPGPDIPGFQKSWTYANAQQSCFVAIHLDLNLGIERRSMTYSSRELLLLHWSEDAVRWAYKEKIVTT